MEYCESIRIVFVCQIEGFDAQMSVILLEWFFFKLKIKVKSAGPKFIAELHKTVRVNGNLQMLIGEGTVVAEFKEITQGLYSKWTNTGPLDEVIPDLRMCNFFRTRLKTFF